MRVAFLSSLVSRKAGGIFVSARQLAQALSSKNSMEVRVFGAIDEHFEEDRIDWEPVEVCGLRLRGPKTFAFMPDLLKSLEQFSPDIVHVHSLWTYVSKAASEYCGKTGIPYIVSPRGCLEPWALKNSKLKKWVALQAYEKAHLAGATALHALATSECESFRRFGIKRPVAIIPNGIRPANPNPPPAPSWLQSILEKKRVLLFLGRLHPKKGILNLVQAAGLLKRSGCKAMDAWHCVIAGWDEVGHLEELKAAIQKEGLESMMTLPGPLYGQEKDAVLSKVQAFILPSYSEGLPMAVLEAWGWSLPTLITPACNLDIAFERGAALKIETDPTELASGLKALFEMPANKRAALGQKAKHLANEKFSWETIALDMSRVYRWALNPSENPVPESVSVA